MQVGTYQHVAERAAEGGDDLLDLTTIGLAEVFRQI